MLDSYSWWPLSRRRPCHTRESSQDSRSTVHTLKQYVDVEDEDKLLCGTSWSETRPTSYCSQRKSKTPISTMPIVVLIQPCHSRNRPYHDEQSKIAPRLSQRIWRLLSTWPLVLSQESGKNPSSNAVSCRKSGPHCVTCRRLVNL